MTIGFIGLGIMGAPMAKNLIKGGFSVLVPARSARAAELTAAGAATAGSFKEVAAKSEVVITMLPNSPEVTSVILGSGEGGVSHIADITDQEAVDAMTLEASQKSAETPGFVPVFQALLAKLSGGGLSRA